MKQYLTPLGKNILRKIYYDVQAKKQSLKENNVDVASYEFQAIQQREIAVRSLFDQMITMPSVKTPDEDIATYYEHLAKKHKEFSSFQDSGLDWSDYLTTDGLPKILELYKKELIAKEAAWHDGVFDYLPKVKDISDIQKCSVNVNYLERQQGFIITLKAFQVPIRIFKNVEDEVRNNIYTLTINDKGQNEYLKIAEVEKSK